MMLLGLLLLCSISFADGHSLAPEPQSILTAEQQRKSDLKNLKFRNYSIQHGLSQATVLSIYQNRQGFIWLGTLEGLNRFDGYQFKTWRFEIDNPNSLSHNVVYQVLEDSSDHLWVATHDGLSKFNPSTESFQRFYNGSPSGSQNSIITMHSAESSHLWIGTERGLFLFDMSQGYFEPFQVKTEENIDLTDKYIRDLEMDDSGNLWIATTEHGLFSFNLSENRLNQYVSEIGRSNTLASNNIRTLLFDQANRLWIGTNNSGVSLFDISSRSIKNFSHNPLKEESLTSDRILSIHQDKDGLIWIGTANAGLNLYDSASDQFIGFQKNVLDPYTIPDHVVRAIGSDQGGNLLLGHSSTGFCIVDKSTQIFRHLKHNPFNSDRLSHDNVWHIMEDSKKNLWIATSDGLNFYDRRSNKYKLFQNEANNSNSISQNYVRYVYEDNKGRIWIGTYGGVNILYPKTGRIERFEVDKNKIGTLSDNRVRCVFQDRDEIIWVATAEGGLNKFDEETKKFKSYINDPANPNSISGNSLRNIVEDKDGVLWLGTDQGLNRFDKSKEIFKSYKNVVGDSLSISNNSIQYLYLSEDGRFWVCTNGGLNLFDPKTEKFKAWGLKQGMSNEIAYGLLEDDDGNFWISTNRGINKFEVKENRFIWYDELDGLQSNEFNAGAFMRDSQGMMYFGGVNGLSVFDPKKVKSNEYIPPVVLTDFLLFNQSIPVAKDGLLKSSVTTQDQIELGYEDYIWAVEFSALNFRQPEKNRFAYKLDPFNEGWIVTSYRDRKAVYTNVPPGEYQFRVKAANDDGKWNDQGISMSIKIRPPWWMLWWMKVLYIVVVATLMIIFYRIRIRRLKRQKEVLKRMVKERTQEIEQKREELKTKNSELGEKNEALSNALNDLASTQQQLIQSEKMASIGVLSSGVAHEINNPLNFIHGGVGGLTHELEQTEIADKRRFSVFIDAIQEGVSRAAKIIKSLNQFSHEGGSNRDKIELHEVIDNCLEILRSSMGDAVTIDKNFTADDITILGSRSKCHQIIVNILTNANHALAKGGKIEITTERHGDTVQLTISDNGVGIPEENLKKVTDPFFTTKAQGQGTGLGMFISYNLIKEMEGTLEITSQVGKGTRVDVGFPSSRIGQLPDDLKVL
ncbi:two-component regulator propeller domain-containing protein [Reichenbachiella sp.]|uniref:two-component regulator propeller domain-containing protein n=1 Tax=Reichenbachiella sp. TaxID=2184521 RepID=UPI003BB0919A